MYTPKSCLIRVIQEMGLKLSEFHPLTVKSGTITGRISATNGEYAHSKTEQYWKRSRGAECGHWVSLRMCEGMLRVGIYWTTREFNHDPFEEPEPLHQGRQ